MCRPTTARTPTQEIPASGGHVDSAYPSSPGSAMLSNNRSAMPSTGEQRAARAVPPSTFGAPASPKDSRGSRREKKFVHDQKMGGTGTDWAMSTIYGVRPDASRRCLKLPSRPRISRLSMCLRCVLASAPGGERSPRIGPWAASERMGRASDGHHIGWAAGGVGKESPTVPTSACRGIRRERTN